MSSADTSLSDLLASITKGSDAHPGFMGELMGMLNSKDGMAGLVEQFKQSGLGDVIQSWVGTGANKPISGEQIREALGSDKIQSMAAQLGLSPDLLSGQLSKVLPQLVDRLTPDGEMPEGGLLEQGLSILRKALK